MGASAAEAGLLVYLAIAAVAGAGLLVLSALLRHRVERARPDKGETYECGEPPFGPAWRKLPVGFYLIALLFILFDVEAAFLFLWVESLAELGTLAFVEMAIFVGVLLLGWVYALRKGDLAWVR